MLLPSAARTSRTRALRQVLLSFFSPYRGRLAVILLLALGTSVLAAGEPLLFKMVFDAFGAGASQIARAAMFLGALVVALLAREALNAVLDCSIWRVRIGINFDMMHATVDRLHALPLSHHREQGVGAVMTKVERGIAGTVAAFSDAAFHLVPAVVYLLISAVVMFRLEWRLSLVVIAFAPLPAVLGARAAKEQMTRERDLMRRWTSLFSRFNEMLSGIAIVKSFVKEEDEKRRFLSGVSGANDVVLRGVVTDATVNAMKSGVMAFARVASIGFGGWLVIRHEITLGTLIAFLGYVSGVFTPVQSLTGMYQTMRKGTVALETLNEVLLADDALGDSPHAREALALTGDVRFDDVHFEYRDGAPVLRGVSFHARPGETIALVGGSGGGKSTLMALLQRLYDPVRGAVLLDGTDIRAFKQKSIRRQISVVLQDAWLFDDTILDNIAFGTPGATREEIEAAARAANAHDFIMALPDGYASRAGERGCKLSGGERQRIAIARALLKNAPILILDEATSALDAESEDAVREAFARLTEGRTTFIIAHRLTTVTGADRIIVLDDGAITESGTHEELIRKRGRYAELVARQARGLAA
jgi:ATP-binding cassette subfamily B protein